MGGLTFSTDTQVWAPALSFARRNREGASSSNRVGVCSHLGRSPGDRGRSGTALRQNRDVCRLRSPVQCGQPGEIQGERGLNLRSFLFSCGNKEFKITKRRRILGYLMGILFGWFPGVGAVSTPEWALWTPGSKELRRGPPFVRQSRVVWGSSGRLPRKSVFEIGLDLREGLR